LSKTQLAPTIAIELGERHEKKNFGRWKIGWKKIFLELTIVK